MKFILFLLYINIIISQHVIGTFKSNRLININTTEQLYQTTLNFTVGHRFGDTYTGLKNFFGLDESPSIYFAFDYGVFDNIQLGLARYNKGKTYEFNSKLRVLRQSRQKDLMPISISFFTAIDFQTLDNAPEENLLLQFLIARKFTKNLSLQISPFYIKRFAAMQYGTNILVADVIGMAFSTRYKVSKRSSIVFEFSQPLNRKEYNLKTPDHKKISNSTISFGYNIEAAGHSFQIVISNSRSISAIKSLITTENLHLNLLKRHFVLGFNMSRLFQL